LFGQWQDRLGHRKTLALTLLGGRHVLIAYVSTTRWLLGRRQHRRLCLGSSQSAGRALVGY